MSTPARRWPAPWKKGVFWLALSAFIPLSIAWHIASGPEVQGDLPLLYIDTPPVSPSAPASRPVVEGDSRVLPAGKGGITLLPELVALAGEFNREDSDIHRDFEILDLLLSTFRQGNGGQRPFGGENDEITAQLRGQNPRRLALIAPDHPAINESGQLLDRWGTPLYFHPVSGHTLEFRSAGPDRKLFTADDIQNP